MADLPDPSALDSFLRRFLKPKTTPAPSSRCSRPCPGSEKRRSSVRYRRLLMEPLEVRQPLTSAPAPVMLLDESFAVSDGGFQANNTGGTFPGLWHFSSGRAGDNLPNHSPPYSWYYGVNESRTGGGRYDLPRDHEGRLRSPIIKLPDCGDINASFNHLLEVLRVADINFDIAQVVVESIFAGRVSNSTIVLQRADGTLGSLAGTWQSVSFSLNAFRGQDIRLMFFFDTVDVVPLDPEGWYIDDVKVQHTRTIDCVNADLEIRKSVVEDTVFAGDTLTYFVTATNLGADNRSGANPGQQDVNTRFRMEDTLPAGATLVSARQTVPPPLAGAPPCAVSGQQLTCDPSLPNSQLAVGSSVTWQITIRVDPSFTGSLVENIARVTQQQPRDKNPANDESKVTTPVAKSADLGIVKLAAPEPVAAGGLLYYSLVVSNFGPSSSGPFTVVDTLPANATLLPASLSPGCVATGALVTCVPPAAPLAPGQTLVWNFTVRVNADAVDSSTVVNTARILNAGPATPGYVPDRNPNNDQATTRTRVIGASDLKLEKRGAATIGPGGLILYTLTVANQGPSPSGTFAVRDTLPVNTTFVEASDGCDHSNGVVTCRYAGPELAVNQNTRWTIQVRVNEAAATDELVENCALLTDRSRPDSNAANDYSCVCSIIVSPSPQADLGIAKTGTPDRVVAGDNINYTVTVTNSGPTPATTFSFVDRIPAGTSFVSVSPGVCSLSQNSSELACVYSGPPLDPGRATSWNVTVKTNANLAASSVIVNQVSLREPFCLQDGNPWNCFAFARTVIDDGNPNAVADLEIAKGDAPNPVVAGGRLTYTVRVTNKGPAPSGSFTVLDAIPIEIVPGSVVAPAGCSFRAPNLVCDFQGSLPVNDTKEWMISVTVDPTLNAGYIIPNVATIAERSVPDRNPWNDIARTRTPVIADAEGEQTVQFVTIFGLKPEAEAAIAETRQDIPVTYLDVNSAVPAPKPGKGAIFGYRRYDYNINGVIDPEDRGLAGRLIYIDTNNDGTYDPQTNEPSILTARDGTYFFDGLDPGVYIVREDLQIAVNPILSRGITVMTNPVKGLRAINVTANTTTRTDTDFAGLSYAPFVRPADDHLGQLIAENTIPTGPGNLTVQQKLDSFGVWQKIVFTNNGSTSMTVLPPVFSSAVPQPSGAPDPSSFLTYARYRNGAFNLFRDSTVDGRINTLFPLSVAPAVNRMPTTQEIYVFFNPNAGGRSYPDWRYPVGPGNEPLTFPADARITFQTNQQGIEFSVRLVGASTFDSDVTYDGAVVEQPDTEFLAGIGGSQTTTGTYDIPYNSPEYHYTLDVNVRCPNGLKDPVAGCVWPIGPDRNIGGEDFGTMIAELRRFRAPFLDLDNDGSSFVLDSQSIGRGGVDYLIRCLPAGASKVWVESDASILYQFEEIKFDSVNARVEPIRNGNDIVLTFDKQANDIFNVVGDGTAAVVVTAIPRPTNAQVIDAIRRIRVRFNPESVIGGFNVVFTVTISSGGKSRTTNEARVIVREAKQSC